MHLVVLEYRRAERPAGWAKLSRIFGCPESAWDAWAPLPVRVPLPAGVEVEHYLRELGQEYENTLWRVRPSEQEALL